MLALGVVGVVALRLRLTLSAALQAGKGRTGVMITCWMLFSGMWPDADASLDFYGAMRTSNRQGVTIPSQVRFFLSPIGILSFVLSFYLFIC